VFHARSGTRLRRGDSAGRQRGGGSENNRELIPLDAREQFPGNLPWGRLFLLLYKEKVRMRLAFEQKFSRELQTMRSAVSRPFGSLTQAAKVAKFGEQRGILFHARSRTRLRRGDTASRQGKGRSENNRELIPQCAGSISRLPGMLKMTERRETFSDAMLEGCVPIGPAAFSKYLERTAPSVLSSWPNLLETLFKKLQSWLRWRPRQVR
jgi:hypothetical protein